MTAKAPVSVVIPCYNCKDTIERALDSVALQTWLPSEVIAVDDGSTDGTLEILHRLARAYGGGWLRVVEHKVNMGPAAARNTGWDLATYPYIAFLDADDAWHPRKIHVQLRYMLAHPEVALTGHRWRLIPEGESFPLLPISEHYTTKPISLWQMLISNRLSTPTVVLQSHLDFRFEPSKRYSEDYLLWLRIMRSGYKAAFIDLELAYLYKAPYGAGGLSGQLWAMETGELDTYRRLRSERLISFTAFMASSVFSMAKYMRRVVVRGLRATRHEA